MKGKRFLFFFILFILVFTLQACKEAEPLTTPAPSESTFDPDQTYWGSATHYHILANLSVADGGRLDCVFKGSSYIKFNSTDRYGDEDGSWSLYYNGECYHTIGNKQPAFSCGGRICDDRFAWGKYYLNPLRLTVSPEMVTCGNDGLNFDGNIIEGRFCDSGTEWNYWLFRIALDGSEAPTDEATTTETTPTVEVTATPGMGCSPQVSGLDPAKPGDVISPAATYYDDKGQGVGIIQERWYINGSETTSSVWDGSQVNLELQYTCLDHSASTMYFTIQPYQEPTFTATIQESTNTATLAPVITEEPSIGNENPPPGGEKPPLTPLGVGVIVGGIIAVTAGIGVAISVLVKGSAKPPAPPPAPVTPPLPVVPPSLTPSALPSAPPSIPTPPQVPPTPEPPPAESEPAEPPEPKPEKLTPEERARLSDIRDQMETERIELQRQYDVISEAIKKLQHIHKNNLIKYIIKQGFEVKDWVATSPVEEIANIVLDPVLDKVFQAHDTSQDGNILVQVSNRIDQLKLEKQKLAKQIIYLKSEIGRTDLKLSG